MLGDLTIAVAAERLRRGELSAVELTRAALDRIAATDGAVHAFLTVTADAALTAAAEADTRLRSGQAAGPLTGIPVAIKDVIATAGVRTTAASKILEHFVPTYDATVTSRLKQAGAVIVGKVNCDEFAMGSSNENSAYGVTRNPWDLARVPGGSSGGSAAAVAAGQALAALGTDTGGSIRLPASFCGVVGLKPTYGRVSRHGVIAFASSLDQPGPLGRTTWDVAALLAAIAGPDPHDLTCAARPADDYLAALEGGARGLRVGVPKEWFGGGLQPEVEARVREALATYQRLGARLVEISLPHTRYGIAAYYLIATAEASANLARYDGVRFGRRAPGVRGLKELYAESREQGFGAEPKRRIMLGTFALSAGYHDAYYLRAQQVRTLIRRDFDDAFSSCDLVAGPVAPGPAFKLGEKTGDPLQMYLADIFTITCNLAALPGLSVPCGLAGGLPVGLQLVGRPFDEATLLTAARALERELGPAPAPTALEAAP